VAPGSGAAIDAIVVGAGPNGLTAAITLAQAGLSVRIYEAMPGIGGGARTEECTLPGFRHDPCSAVHPLGRGSPAFRAMPLGKYGLRWIEPSLQLAHPQPDGSAAVLARSLDETASSLGADGGSYRSLVTPFLGHWEQLASDVLRPVAAGPPAAPWTMARFGLPAMAPARLLARRFGGPHARTLIAGLAAHALAPLGSPLTGGVAMMFALAAHEVGWPFPAGGSQSLADALAAHLTSLGGEIVTGRRVLSLDELPAARVYLLDVSPRDLVRIAGARLPARWSRRLARVRYGPAVFKVDYALDGPVPWLAEDCRRAGTVHIGASDTEISTSLALANDGAVPDRPFLITAQPTVFDPSRAPPGKHVFWAYAQVPNGSPDDALPAVEAQIERFAPGFRDLVLARKVTSPRQIEERNPNNVGGNIAVGRCDGLHAVLRPTLSLRLPYRTGNPAIYLCSSATAPGPGVHGMCGLHAARTALRHAFGIRA
jgi:phytoene dehydrogenase-like protein